MNSEACVWMTRGIIVAAQSCVFRDLERHGMGWGAPMDYPAGIERDVVLKNGETVRIRPIRPDDEPRLVALYDRFSRHTAYQRFFTARQHLPQDWIHYFANVDYRRRLAIVGERDTVAGIELVGVGRYEPRPRARRESPHAPAPCEPHAHHRAHDRAGRGDDPLRASLTVK
jgi:hypothetical protein